MTTVTVGPSWDIESEYTGFDDPNISADEGKVHQLINSIEKVSSSLLQDGVPVESPEQMGNAQEILTLKNQVLTLLGNLRTWANCLVSVDGTNQPAKTMLGAMQSLGARLGVAMQPWQRWVQFVSEDTFRQFLQSQEASEESFKLNRTRMLKEYTLSLEAEKILKTMEINGPVSWGNLYDNLSGTIAVPLEEVGELGLAQAMSLLESPEREKRQKAWEGVNEAWGAHEDAVAAGINNIAGWRLDEYNLRSTKKKMDYLDSPLHSACITKKTLETMLSTVKKQSHIARDVLKTQAKCLGLDSLGPWDLFAPPPPQRGVDHRPWPFEKAMEVIRSAFASIHPDMGEFVDIMNKNKWIEGTATKTKRPGAYCTRFAKSRTPRVYMTYNGGIKDVITLAHELGHAFHGWVMRELPLCKTWYPMTLAETASIFAQTVVHEALQEQCTSKAELLPVLWADAREAEAFLLNIPARFDFENSFYSKRKKGPLPAAELKELMEESWQTHYKDTLSQMNPMFWASKLHFHIAGLSFYNFPYTFGYLFSLGVYSQRDKLGADFYNKYVDLLRETGSMTAEELALKHLDAHLEDEAFWLNSIKMIESKVKQFQEAAAVSH